MGTPVNAEFIHGFRHAISALANEGDHRCADWSAPYQYLKSYIDTFEVEGPKEIGGIKLVVSPAVAENMIEFHHEDGRVDRFKING
jgi:hypothetical protein